MKNKFLKSILVGTASMAFIASVVSVNFKPVLAEGGDTEDVEDTVGDTDDPVATTTGSNVNPAVTEVPLVKLFKTREDTIIPTIGFNFSAEAKEITEGTTKSFTKKNSTETFSVNVYSGVENGLYDATGTDTSDHEIQTVFTAPTAADNLQTSYSQTAKWKINADAFNASGTNYQPGLYAYTITEGEPDRTIEGITKDTTSYVVYVNVERQTTSSGDRLVPTGVIAYKVTNGVEATAKDPGTTDDGTGETGSYLKFTNKYGVDNTTPGGDPEDPNDPAKDTVNNFYVTKHITGNQADKGKKFTFTISGTGARNEQFVGVAPDGTKTLVTADETGAFEFTATLSNGETYKVTGLSNGDTISATEESLDYTATYSKATTNTLTTIADYSSTNGYANQEAISQDTFFHVNNDKSGEIPTGVIMTYGPYVAMVIIAAGLFFVFARKKEEQENY